MDIIEKIDYWIAVAGYDLETSLAMLKTKRYLYVGFMCHQVVEKALKAYYWKERREEPPYTHNLLELARRSGIESIISETHKNLITILMPLNIQARYPKTKEMIRKMLNNHKATSIYNETHEFYKWIKKLLKK